MMTPGLSRRRFLKLTASGVAGVGLGGSLFAKFPSEEAELSPTGPAEPWTGQWIGYNPIFPRELPADGPQSRLDWRGANWMWTGEAKPQADAPAGARWFRWTFHVPAGPDLKAAWLQFTASDPATLLVNGRRHSASRGRARSPEKDVRDYIQPGKNVFGVMAEHTAGPAGWSLKLCIETEDGSLTEITPQAGETLWIDQAPGPDPYDENWSKPEVEPTGWHPGAVLGAMGMAPWGFVQPNGFLPGSNQTAPAPLLRRSFTLIRRPKRARLRSSGLGCHELHCNGVRVGDAVLEPAMTQYDKTVLFVEHDLTSRLTLGRNALAVMLGHGWYAATTATVWDFDTAAWRDRPKLLLNLHLEYDDGTTDIIATDATWKGYTGPVVTDDLMNGEHYDARLAIPGWTEASFDDRAWATAEIMQPPKGTLRRQSLPPMRVTQTLQPVKRWEARPGVHLFDLGQNIAGWVRISVRGPAGTRIILRHGEVLRQDRVDRDLGNYTWNGAFQEDQYILRGEGLETWEPRFTYHGFRYVEVEGWPGTPELSALEGRVVHTEFARAGSFACSNPMLNQLQEAILWSYRGNFHGFPTDCPTREKKGWLGDAHLACEQAMLNWENRAGYHKWMEDFIDVQDDTGGLKYIVPSPGWGAEMPDWNVACLLIPWWVHLYTGDMGILQTAYPMMRKWAALRAKLAKDHLQVDGVSDWLTPKTKTPIPVTSTAYYYGGLSRLAIMAERLGHLEQANAYRDECAAIARAFRREFVQTDGRVSEGSQAAQACALYFGLVPENLQAAAARKLSEAVTRANDHVDVGLLGSKALFRVLSDHGYHEQAYRVATQRTAPGYGYMLAQGCTTLTEDWLCGGSQNHVMLGDISAWFYQYLAGIQVDETAPGFRHFYLKPRPVGDLTWVSAEHHAPRGLIQSKWERQAGGGYRANFIVPPGCRATVDLPDGRREIIAPGSFVYTWG
jgi:alpha-L-rhamnosidase